jgi:DNA replication and repair protein RecF
LKLQNIRIVNFRNHSLTQFDCSPGINIFLGSNGEGKTNILEGITYSCLSKSFFSASDTLALKIGEKEFSISGVFISDRGVRHDLQILFDAEQKQKTVTVNKTRVLKLSSLVGEFPVVVLSPDQSSIAFGVPADRRYFVDFVVSQSNRKYLEDIISYRKILKQRNKILTDMRQSHKENDAVLDIWNDSMIQAGSAIIKKRNDFLTEFKNIMNDSYNGLAGSNELPSISYEPSFRCNYNDLNEIEARFKAEIKTQRSIEKKIGHSLVGPHRDEIDFRINNLSLRSYASQGQHKTFLVALKLAEFNYLKNQCNETPILLLDDVLSELDEKRTQCLLETISGNRQVFLTSTNDQNIKWNSVISANPRKFYIKQGSVERVQETACIN